MCYAMEVLVILSRFYLASYLVSWCLIGPFGHLEAVKLLEAVDPPQDVRVARGDSTYIRCAFRHPIHGCGWRRNGVYVRSAGRYEYFSRIDSDGIQRCDIHISRANQDQDGGLWACATHRNQTFQSIAMPPAKLIVIDALIRPADPVILFDKEEVTDRLSEPALSSELVCVSRRGNPSTRLHWELISADGTGRVRRIPDNPRLFSTKIAAPRQSTSVSDPDDDGVILYDSFLWLDMLEHREALEAASEIKCVAEHPTYGGADDYGQRYVALLDESSQANGDLTVSPRAPQSESNTAATDQYRGMLLYMWAIISAALILVILLGFIVHYARRRHNHKVSLSNGKTKTTRGKHESFVALTISAPLGRDDFRTTTGQVRPDSTTEVGSAEDDDEDDVGSPTPAFPPPPPPLPPSPSLKPLILIS